MWQCASISPGMIHCPAASITCTLRRSSRLMSGGSAPTPLILLPSMTTASLRADGLPDPSIRVPLRITRVWTAVIVIPPGRTLRPAGQGGDVGREYKQLFDFRPAEIAGGRKSRKWLTFAARHAAWQA